MKDDQHFRDLLYRYLNKEITDKEKTELHYLMHSGVYDDVIEAEFTATLLTEIADQLSDDTMDDAPLYQDIRQYLPITNTGGKDLFRTPRFWYTAAAVFLLAAGLTISWLGREEKTEQPIALISEEHQQILLDNKDFYHLPDGSTVLLNENSRLSYAEPFGENSREVFLTGEAFFDIKHDPSHPFIVHTGHIITKVLGTAFNINAQKEEVTVTVSRGLVEVGSQTATFDQLRPDEKMIINLASNDFQKIRETELKEKTWITGRRKTRMLSFQDRLSQARVISLLFSQDFYRMRPIYD